MFLKINKPNKYLHIANIERQAVEQKIRQKRKIRNTMKKRKNW